MFDQTASFFLEIVGKMARTKSALCFDDGTGSTSSGGKLGSSR
jgi:hypothetical protein